MESPPPPPLSPSRDRRNDNERRRDRDPRRDRGDDDRDYKRRRSPGSPPPPTHRSRDRRPSPSYKRSRRDDRRLGAYGGRSGSYSGDERSSGRRQEYGRGTRDGFLSGRKEGLMTYKQFIAELEDDVSPAEAEHRYLEYKNEFISTQKKAFFEQNKQEEWLRDMYDPSRLETVIQRRNESSRLAAKQFATDLESGSLDLGPGSAFHDQKAEQNPDEELDGRSRNNGHGVAKTQLINEAPKVPSISYEPKRINKDIEQARALISKLDNEKGIEQNILVPTDTENPIVIVKSVNHVKGYEGVELLDVVLTYLWRVHFVDYYGSREYKEQPKVLRHIRPEKKANEDAPVLCAEWEKKLDTTWQKRLQGKDPLVIMMAEEKLEDAMSHALEPLVRKIKDERYGWKYGCGAKNCSKLFHGPEFVHKHLKLKHPELVTEVSAKVYEELYFENYMSDPDAPGSTPVMASQASRKLSSGREVGRPNRDSMERDNDQSPLHEEFDGMERLDGDKLRYDGIGSRLRGHPTMGIPPVLMPVPGAGPLGPFVPAPPEVAMRMWREQSSTGPYKHGGFDGTFDGEGASSRGNRKRVGPPGAGLIDTPPMVLPLPNMHHDSRRTMRSYRDLDVPEDEVSVIDYRTL